MKIYRYEKADGGGPWFDLNGKARFSDIELAEDKELFGCRSVEELKEYFSKTEHKVDLSDCYLVMYNIPDEECKVLRSGEVTFPKRYSSCFSSNR